MNTSPARMGTQDYKCGARLKGGCARAHVLTFHSINCLITKTKTKLSALPRPAEQPALSSFRPNFRQRKKIII